MTTQEFLIILFNLLIISYIKFYENNAFVVRTYILFVNGPIIRFVFIIINNNYTICPFSSFVPYITSIPFLFSLSNTNEGIFQPLWIIITKNLISCPCYLKLVFSSIYTMCRNNHAPSFPIFPFALNIRHHNKYKPFESSHEFSINFSVLFFRISQ